MVLAVLNWRLPLASAPVHPATAAEAFLRAAVSQGHCSTAQTVCRAHWCCRTDGRIRHVPSPQPITVRGATVHGTRYLTRVGHCPHRLNGNFLAQPAANWQGARLDYHLAFCTLLLSTSLFSTITSSQISDSSSTPLGRHMSA